MRSHGRLALPRTPTPTGQSSLSTRDSVTTKGWRAKSSSFPSVTDKTKDPITWKALMGKQQRMDLSVFLESSPIVVPLSAKAKLLLLIDGAEVSWDAGALSLICTSMRASSNVAPYMPQLAIGWQYRQVHLFPGKANTCSSPRLFPLNITDSFYFIF